MPKDKLLKFIEENKEDLSAEKTLLYGEKTINAETELRRYGWVLSIGILSFRFDSNFYISSTNNFWRGFCYVLPTIILGWWGIPFGPIWTVQALLKNFRGGESFRVRHFLS